MKNFKPIKPTTKHINCLKRNCAGFPPSSKHFGAVAENIAKNPMITRKATTIKSVLSGEDIITL